MTDSILLYKGPCPDCGSSDACAVYNDGHTYCFSCEKPGHGGAYEPMTEPKANDKFITTLIPRALKSRGLTLDTCKKYDYQAGTIGSDITHVAQYYLNGQHVAQHVRKVDEKDFYWIGKSKDVELFGQHLWGREKSKQIIITEGEIDCLTIAQCLNLTWPVVSIPSGVQSAKKALQRNLEFLLKFDNIILAFDDDDPGREAVEKCVSILPTGRVKVMHYDNHKDANALYLDKGAKDVVSQVYNATPYRPDGIISGAAILKRMKEKPSIGFDILYPGLSDMLFGFDTKRLHMFTGGSGIGKSTLVHEVAYDLVHRHGNKLAVFALEESIREAALRHVTITENKPMHLEKEISDELVDSYFAKTFTGDSYHFYEHFGSSDINTLLDKMRFTVVSLGCTFLILDHISMIVSGIEEIKESERKTIDRFMTATRSLIEETGVGVLGVVHLKRPDKGKPYNEGTPVSLSDLRGSGGLEQISDNVIALERDQQGKNPDIGLIRVLKNRKAGKTGIAGYVKYDSTTGRLLHTDFNPEDTAEDYGFSGDCDF